MRLFRRRRTTSTPAAADDAPSVGAGRFRDDAESGSGDAAAHDTLRRIVDEAVLLQGLTEDMLAGIRLRRSLSELAAPGRALISRFGELRAAVPEPMDARLRDVAQTLRETLDHHALMLHCSLDLLADLRPERVAGQGDQLTGLGAPARRLCALQEQLNGAYGGQRPSRVA
jgi:hypothetical protein